MRFRFGAIAVALALAAVPACKKGKGSKSPGGKGASKEQVEAAVAKAKEQAEVSAIVKIANKDLASGRWVSAKRRADEALEKNPDSADAYTVLGAALWRAGDFVGSTKAYRTALEKDEGNFGAIIGLARNLQASGRNAEAAELQDRLLKDDKEQVDPLITKLYSYYATADADKAIPVIDEIFRLLPADDPQQEIVAARAAYLRAIAGKGKICEVTGKTGKSDANVDRGIGLKYTGAEVGGDFTRVIFFEMREESVIDTALVKKLKLKEVGKYKPVGSEDEVKIVLVPEIKFGDLSLKNIPAIVQPLEAYEQAMGERPGIMLGRQALSAVGAITFDFPTRTLTLEKDVPASPPDGSAELPFIILFNAPAIPISINGSDHTFFVYLGGIFKSGVAIAKKHYFKSGKLPRDVENPEDKDAGLKMVYLDSLKVGDKEVGGVGALVLVNDPPDGNLSTLLDLTAFELGGYLNLALLENWKITYALSSGKVFVDPG